MRLLHAETLEFHEFQGTQIPEYAILSHRWENEEVTYQDMKRGWLEASAKEGFGKILQCCRQALQDGLAFFWVDTCCIDKTSSAELTEAINSMWLWYKESRVCYAYLSDVYSEEDGHKEDESTKEIRTTGHSASPVSQFLASKWWTRGWTLQELIAPETVKFFANDEIQGWTHIGDKSSLLELIASRTNIHRGILRGMDIRKCSIANRMSWAAERETTRIEDMAYCLLGIFGVNMPLLYGEGERAFLRLQEEIMKQSDDQTLFAWELEPNSVTEGFCGPLATSPSQFRGCSGLFPIPDTETPTPYSMTNKGLRMELPILRSNDEGWALAILQCSTAPTYPMKIAIPLIRAAQRSTKQTSSLYARDHRRFGPLKSYVLDTLTHATPQTIYMRLERERNVEMYAEHLVHIKMGLPKMFELVYFDPKLFIALEHDNYGHKTYLLPSDCTRGAIIFVNPFYDLLVLFNFELQHIGRMSCKVLCASPHDKESRDSDILESKTSDSMDQQSTPSEPFLYSSLIDFDAQFGKSDQRRFDIYRSIDDLHGEFTVDSNSRGSFSYLPGEGVAYSSIGMMQSVEGQSTLSLSLEIYSLTDEQSPLHELDGNSTGPEQSPELDGIMLHGKQIPELDGTGTISEVRLGLEGTRLLPKSNQRSQKQKFRRRRDLRNFLEHPK